MSFDVLIIKPSNATIEDLSAVEDVAPLGETLIVENAINSAFPGAVNGIWQSRDFSVEAQISGNPVESAHLTVHFASTWAKASEIQLLKCITTLCQK
jgi:hypothetical protein